MNITAKVLKPDDIQVEIRLVQDLSFFRQLRKDMADAGLNKNWPGYEVISSIGEVIREVEQTFYKKEV